MNKVFVGIDTSNYKTSIAAVDLQGEVLFEKSVLLDVKKGSRGLRQSEAFFAHSNRLPGFISELFTAVDPRSVSAVGVSGRPRRLEGSYMPCFLAGVNAAEVIASSLRAPVYSFSHQEGHAAAVMLTDSDYCSGTDGACLFMHLSGGTTEFLICEPDDSGFRMEIAGGTKDISAGQLLDRFGVAIGMDFPSGSFLDEKAFKYLSGDNIAAEVFTVPGYGPGRKGRMSVLPSIKIEDGYFNLSGAETRLMNHAAEMNNNNADNEDEVTAELFCCIAGLLYRSACGLCMKHDLRTVYMAGGVASSRTVRMLIEAYREHSLLPGNNAPDRSVIPETVPEIRFGAPELSGDNAVGIALLACRAAEMSGKKQ